MAHIVIMPRQGISVESCIITQWNKNVGDKVNIGDVLFSYETDKASFEEEATIEGVMLAILREEDDDVPCLENVCVIGNSLVTPSIDNCPHCPRYQYCPLPSYHFTLSLLTLKRNIFPAFSALRLVCMYIFPS